MVNVKNLFGMAVMATALVGCASNDDITPNANEGNQTGAAYASFKINLPTTSGTRADDPKPGTPSFEYGDAKEYEVKNGTVLIFDESGNFVESANLGNMNPWTDVKSDGVTTAAIATVQLQKVTVGGKYKALVLLNNNTDTTPKVTLPTASTDTYDEWSKNVKKVNVKEYESTDGIFMANAPMYVDSSTEPTTLVQIANICASPEEAQSKAATTVYVERGLAKVTMQKFATNYTIAAGTTYEGGKVVIENWQLDVTNKSTFPIHQTGTLKKAWDQIWNTPRFYDTTSKSFKRVYWGIDPNYSDNQYSAGSSDPKKTALDYCKEAFNMITKGDIKGEAGDDKPQYCLENTFNLANMMQGQTTRVVFKAVFTPKDFSTGDTFYKIGNNTAVWSKDNLETQIRTVALTVMGITDATEQSKYRVDLSKGSNISGTAGQHVIQAANIIYTGEASSSKVSDDNVAKINEKLGLSATAGISTYLNGVSYYIARIKHFNDLAPWKAGESYGSDNATYLGRYGVLRNNWYSLSVSSVSGLGYPDVPEVKPTVPDDENDKYINVEVKILSWAKRSQSINL